MSRTRGAFHRPFTTEVLAAARAREDEFLTVIMPRVRRSAWRRFRGFSQYWREDAIQDAIGNAWLAFCRIIRAGEDPMAQIGSIVKFSVTALFYYRNVCGRQPINEPFSRWAQEQRGFRCISNIEAGSSEERALHGLSC
jgi:hypothetical protein